MPTQNRRHKVWNCICIWCIVNKSKQWDSPERERDVLGGSRMSRRRSNGLLPLFPLEERRLLWFLTSDRWKGESDCWRRRMSPSMSSIPIPLMPCSVGAVFMVEDAGEVNLPLPDPPFVDVKRGWSEDENKPSFDLGRMPDKSNKKHDQIIATIYNKNIIV